MSEPARILIVDDDPKNVKIVKLILMEDEHRLATAFGGLEALQKAKEFNPDLILLDIMMPDISGCEVSRRLKSDPATADIPIIMLTARSDMEALEESFQTGAMDYIRKPFHDRELILRVNNAIMLRRSMMENQKWRNQMVRDLNLAGSLQQSILPSKPVFNALFDACFCYRPSIAIGGDVFDVLQMPDGRVAVYMGDVSGHGVGPALASCLVKAMLTELLRASSSAHPSSICQELEHRFREYIPNPSMYMTMFLMIYDPRERQWNCMSCGHPPPMFYHGLKRLRQYESDEKGGMPVGFNSQTGASYEQADEFVLPFEPGMRVVMFTDGLLEAAHEETGEMCDREGVAEMLETLWRSKNSFNLADRLVDGLQARGYQTEADDCSAVVLDFVPTAALASELSISPNMDSIRGAADVVTKRLNGAQWPQTTQHAVELLIVEYANNVVDHSHLAAGESIELVVRQYTDDVTLIFADYGAPWDIAGQLEKGLKSQHNADTASRGRGMGIIGTVAETWQFFRSGERNYCIFKVLREWQLPCDVETANVSVN